MVKIKQLIKVLGTQVSCRKLFDFKVSGLSCNSKTVKDGFVFVAINGNRQDGNKFIGEAIFSGAKAVIVQSQSKFPAVHRGVSFIKVKDARKTLGKLAAEFYGNPSLKTRAVGVTGTNGKTTITYLVEAIIKGSGDKAGVIGTINYRFKDRAIKSGNTTPGAIQLQDMLASMLKCGIKYAVMEVSSHALDQNRTEGINFHSAIFTNLTQDHLDYHKTLANYFKCKAQLFKSLSPKAFAVINLDDPYAVSIRKLTKAKVISYGIKNSAQVMAKNIKFDITGTEFILSVGDIETLFKTSLIGRHNVYNILAAVAWAIQEGISVEVIKSAIKRFSHVPGRLERIEGGHDFSVFVDYAHTEDALENILLTLRHFSKKRIIVVFGCGGERDKMKRPKMARVVSKLSDYAIITNDNPRSEEPLDIIADICSGISGNSYCVIPDRYTAIKKSLSFAKKGDIVLVAGKGHEDYQIIKDKVTHFDDRQVIRECLQSLNY